MAVINDSTNIACLTVKVLELVIIYEIITNLYIYKIKKHNINAE